MAADAFEEAREQADKPEAEDEPAKPTKRQARTGLGQRWQDALNTEDPGEKADGKPGDLENVELVSRLNALVDSMQQSTYEKARRERMRGDLELLHGEPIADIESAQLALGAVDEDGNQIFHASYSVLSTIKNRIVSFRPRAQFLPSGGNGKARRASRDMTALSDAWADSENFHAEASMMLDDSLSCDVGVLKYYIEEGGEKGPTKVGRFPPWEILVEEADGRDMTPECMYHVRDIPASQVAAQLGVDVGEIVEGDAFGAKVADGRSEAKVRMIDAYQVASGKRKGRHVVVFGKRLELDDDWSYEEAPFTVSRWDKKRTGWPGMSAMSKLRGSQAELNDMQVTLREAHYNAATKYIAYRQNEEAPTGFNNDYVSLLAYSVDPPIITTPPAINAEAYQYVQTIKDQMYETLGTNRMSATGTVPKGVDAAVAMRELNESATDRIAEATQEWERLRVDGAKWWWRLTRDYARSHPDTKPKWRAISKGAWRDMVFDDLEGEYQIERYPSSLFGQSLPGRFQRASDLIKQGWIEREDAMAALDVPDISPLIDLELAEKNLMEQIVDDILEEEQYTTPDEYIRPEQLFNYARKRYLVAVRQNIGSPGFVSDKSLDLMRRLLNYTKPKTPAAPPMPGAAEAPPGMPGGGPPPPMSPPGPPMAPPMPGLPPAMPPGPPMPMPGAPMEAPPGLPPVMPVTPVQ